MQYSFEVYVGDGSQYEREFADHGGTPYTKPDSGEYIHPSWRITEGHAVHPGDRLQVERVEHLYWEGHHTMLVFCREEPSAF